MDKNRPMPLLLIEDDVADCIQFKNCVNNRTDVTFVGMTGSSSEGLKYLQALMPEGIILDLELHKGTGSGLLFLAELKKADLTIKPIIIVTTNSPSNIVYNHVRDFGVDMIFYKRQTDYCAEMVVNTMVSLRKSWFAVGRSNMPGDLHTIESPEEHRKRIMERIYTELDLIGIGVRYKGREYFEDAIFALINKEKNSSDAVIYQVAELRKATYSSVIRAMQTAINRAWETSSIEDLQKYYTARVNINTGVPSPTDFIHYYADKIRKTM
jgi:DNA-binding NarL/FixJ family response regulator